MPLRNRHPLLLLGAMLVPLFLAGPARGPAIPPMCTEISFPWIRDGNATWFIATGLSDSIYAGTWIGQRDWSRRDAHQDTVALYGQLLRIDSVAGKDSARLREALEVRDDRLAFVWWDVLPDCRRVPLSGYAPFVQPGHRVFIAVGLTPSSNWVDGLPLAHSQDLTDYYDPATVSYWGDLDKLALRPALSVDLYFRSYPELPTTEAWRRDPKRERRRLEQWAKKNPDVSKRMPFVEHLWFMRRDYQMSIPRG